MSKLLLCDYWCYDKHCVGCCLFFSAFLSLYFNNITNPKVPGKGWGHGDAPFFPLLHSFSVCSSCTKETKSGKGFLVLVPRWGEVGGFEAAEEWAMQLTLLNFKCFSSSPFTM